MTNEDRESAYDELGGMHRDDAYTVTGAIDRKCGDCGADVDAKCTYEVETFVAGVGVVKVTKERKTPCVNR